MLRGFDAAEAELVRELAASDPHHLYEGLLTVLLRLVFVLYAEDRDLMPSHRDGDGLKLYEEGYSVRSLFARLENDTALHPDTMDERRGAWGQLLALFRLIHGGHRSGFMQARGGKLFDETIFPFLMGKRAADEPDRVLPLSDGCVHRVLESLMIVNGERLSYRTLDVEQIGSVYETVMGFTAQLATGRSIAIKAGKKDRTPVFVNLDELITVKPADRIKYIKENTDRGKFSTAVERELKAADTTDQLVAAFAGAGSARSATIDERGSPHGAIPPGTPILQPTDERRRTGSHYTPRSLTEPIVSKALEPAFARMGDTATPEEVLSLKVCDPACGSGAFLVEATRQIGSRLVKAWEAHPALKPAIPQDEDDELHARRLVAQRCIYGVDRNPMATDLAKLSLWLATLARDHEFSFLDHALKSGDSLVGLNKQQLSGGSWDNAPVRSTLIGQTVADRVERLAAHRDAIRNAPDDVTLAMQESRHAIAERDAENVRLIGNAIIAAFFKHTKPKQRFDEVRYVTAMAGTSNWWDGLRNIATSLEGGVHPIRPFHWEIEFPEVFSRDNPGFDSIVGNPPFAGKNTTIAGNREHYLEWLQTLHTGAHGNADLVAHFFRRAFGLIRQGGSYGLIATNTIGQGDTRETGLCAIIASGGAIAHAVKRLKWPGEAAVVVSVVHVVKGETQAPSLDGRPVSRVSAYLVDGELDGSPITLSDNENTVFEGTKIYGGGFLFRDDKPFSPRNTIAAMHEIISANPESSSVIFPFLGGEDINNDPLHRPSRMVIDFSGRSIAEAEQRWPELIDLVRETVKPSRDKVNRDKTRENWWLFEEARPGLYRSIKNLEQVLITCRVSPHLSIARVPARQVFGESVDVFALTSDSALATLQSRIHEIWARFFASSMKDDLRYTPSDCFETFPLPPGYESASALEAAGKVYHDHRAEMMIATDKGMTKTYNRFHDPNDRAADIVELRRLHAMMDDAVLRAYGWDDLAARAHPGDPAGGIPAGEDAPRFLTEDDEDDHKYQKRLFWPAPFRDELLARLLRENETRAAAEREAN